MLVNILQKNKRDIDDDIRRPSKTPDSRERNDRIG